ncbi:nardilysin-like [Ceratina calcarata]|uniref:Nardilysin-like n=1 Tax=Ceratina calcarata TaxID=156304 RepID=A0AAJ7IUI3_9HYME|nr:nardilysin-like [Ceratina calcarata]
MVTRLQRFLVTKVLRQCSVKSSHTTIMPKRSLQNPPEKKLKPNQASTNAINSSDFSTTHNLERDSMVVNTKNAKSQATVDCKCRTEQDSTGRRTGVSYLDTPVKSETDKKEYRVIQLENGLTALLISDQSNLVNQEDLLSDKDDGISSESESEASGESEEEVSGESSDGSDSEDGEDCVPEKSTKREEKMAACALSVGVGSFSDPPEIPGLAHFLEHMVFMGSEKYTEENDFDAFIKKKGGMDNASTECELTTFYFEIQEKYLLAALHRFAQFFITPLMKKDAITREREAVESEFQMALPSDSCRKDQLFCSLARENHPASKFSWGNLITLRDNVVDDKLYEELHKFRERHYSAHRMKLAIQARLPLEVLENYVKKCFSEVPNNDLPPDDFSRFIGADSFDTPNFHKMYRIKPVKDICQVDLTWSMPPLLHLYKSKPHEYIAWIIEYQGKGSLISYLKSKMWCLEISCRSEESSFEYSSLYALFTLSLTLTEQGHENLPDVLNAVFSFINLARREGPQKRIYDEIHQIKETNFRFTEESLPVEYVEELCENMHYYPPIDYITGSELHFEYNPEAIEDCMSYLTPERVNIIVSNKKYNEEELDKVEPWFKTKYAAAEIPPESVENWKDIEPYEEFHLPLPNPFLTDDSTLIAMPADVPKYPTKVFSDDIMEVWYRPDPKFGLPDCYMLFFLTTPLACSLKSAVLTDLFVVVLKYLLEETLYPALVAELHHEIDTTEKGIIINVNGFNQKLPLVLMNVAKCLKEIPALITEELFDVLKHAQIKRYYNDFVKPKHLIRHVRLSILMLTHWTSVDKHSAIQSIDFHEFLNFAKHLPDHLYVKSLIQGNMTEEDAIKNAREFVSTLGCGPLLPNTMPEIRVMQIPIGKHYCKVKNFNSTDVNSVITNYYQVGISSIKLLVIIELLMMIMEEPLFNQLRTQEQLGYVVFCTQRYTLGILGYTITVYTQADKYTTEHVDNRIDSFLETFNNTLKEMLEKELNDIKDSLIRMKLCADVDLKEEVDRNWEEITSGDYMFDRIENELAVIKSIKIDELREWMNVHMIDGNSLRQLSVHVVGTAKSDDKGDNGDVEETSECLISCCPKKEDSGNAKYTMMYVAKPEDSEGASTSITNIQEYKNRLFCYPVVHTTL